MFTKRPPRRPRSVTTGTLSSMRGLAVAGSLAVGSLASFQPAVAADKSAPAERLGAADRQAIESTIRQQLDAFGRDDADGAFGFATPDIQRMFGSSDNFMRMVRENYEPVYRASGVQFERLTPAPSGAPSAAPSSSPSVGLQWIQTVRLTDDEGKVWRALFTMRRQADRLWKVGGCQLVETSGLST